MRKRTHLVLRFTGPPSGNHTLNAAKQTPDTAFHTMKYTVTSPNQRTFLLSYGRRDRSMMMTSMNHYMSKLVQITTNNNTVTKVGHKKRCERERYH